MPNENIVEKEVQDEAISEKQLKKLEKQQKRREKKELKKSKKKSGGFVRLVLTFLIIMFAVFAFLYFNIFNIRANYVDDKIVGTPLEKVFANAPGNEMNSDSENADSSSVNANASRGELLQEVDRLNGEVALLEEELSSEKEMNDLYVDRIDQLQPLADEQLQFKADKEAFDQMIASNDPNAYSAFYESIYPENADDIYRSLISNEAINSETSDYISKFTAMDEDKAAGILAEMSKTDLNLVVNILNGMSSDKAGIILSEMDTQTAAVIAKRMAPTDY